MSFYCAKGLLTGGVGAVATVGTGVTGWKLHQEINLTVEGVFNRMGHKTSPIKPSEATHNPTTSQVFTWKAWDCVNRLFPGLTVNHELVPADEKVSTTVTSALPNETNDNGGALGVGCLDMNLHPWKDAQHASRLHLQMELALRKEDMGVVLWTAMSHGKLKASNDATTSFDFYHRMILLEKKSGQWQVKGGYEWIDYSMMTNFNEEANFVTIKAPDGTYLLNRGIIQNMTRSSQWIGVWEESSDGKHPLRDIDVQVGTTSDDKASYELYGLDNAFDPNTNTHHDAGYKCIVSYYDPTISKWKKVGRSQYPVNQANTLKTWYKPFQDKNGRWKEIGKVCKSLNEGPRHKWASAGWRREICFEKTASRT